LLFASRISAREFEFEEASKHQALGRGKSKGKPAVATGGSFPCRFSLPNGDGLYPPIPSPCVFLISIIGLLMQISPKFNFLP